MLTSTQRDTIVAALEWQRKIYMNNTRPELNTELEAEFWYGKVVAIDATLTAVNALAGVEVVPDGKHATQYDDDAIFVRGDVLTIVEAGGSHKGGFEARTRLPKGWALIRTSEGVGDA